MTLSPSHHPLRALLAALTLGVTGCTGLVSADAGPVADAGLAPDAGAGDAGPGADGGPGADAGPHSDGGPIPRPDAGWPAWRLAMVDANTIYDISDDTVSQVVFDFGDGGPPTQYLTADDGNSGTAAGILGYGGGALMREVGPFGVIAFGSGGHNFAGNYAAALNLNGPRAKFEVWQQPIFARSAEPGAEFYWSPTDAAALPPSRQLPHLGFDASLWDGGFPLAIGGWVYPAPVRYVEVAEGVPTGQYRYDQHTYIPSAFTGLGTGVWFIPNNLMIAPGFIYGIDGALTADAWPSGRKKWYSHYQREDTRAWSRVGSSPVPEGYGPGGFYPGFFGGSAGFSEKHKLVFVPAGSDNEAAVFDVSQGLAQGTWSWRTCARKTAWSGHQLGKSAMSNGHPRNRAFYVWYGTMSTLNIVDLDDPTYPLYSVPMPGLTAGPANLAERAGLHYLASRDRFVAFGINGTTAYCQLIKIPDDLSDFTAYQLEDCALQAAAGVSLAGSYTPSGLVQYVESLGVFVFMGYGTPAKAFWLQ